MQTKLAKLDNGKSLSTTSPFRLFDSMVRDIDKMFGDIWEPLSRRELTYFSPDVSIKETEKEYKLSMAVPGINKQNMTINCHKGRLSISYENKEQGENDFSYQSFSRSWSLPENVNDSDINAEYIDGVLKISIPKTAETPQKTIQIK